MLSSNVDLPDQLITLVCSHQELRFILKADSWSSLTCQAVLASCQISGRFFSPTAL